MVTSDEGNGCYKGRERTLTSQHVVVVAQFLLVLWQLFRRTEALFQLHLSDGLLCHICFLLPRLWAWRLRLRCLKATKSTVGRTWALKPEQAAFDRTKPRTSHTVSTHTCSQWWYLLVSWSDLALCFHHPQKAEGLQSPHAVALGTGPESLPSGFHRPEKHTNSQTGKISIRHGEIHFPSRPTSLTLTSIALLKNAMCAFYHFDGLFWTISEKQTLLFCVQHKLSFQVCHH